MNVKDPHVTEILLKSLALAGAELIFYCKAQELNNCDLKTRKHLCFVIWATEGHSPNGEMLMMSFVGTLGLTWNTQWLSEDLNSVERQRRLPNRMRHFGCICRRYLGHRLSCCRPYRRRMKGRIIPIRTTLDLPQRTLHF